MRPTSSIRIPLCSSFLFLLSLISTVPLISSSVCSVCRKKNDTNTEIYEQMRMRTYGEERDSDEFVLIFYLGVLALTDAVKRDFDNWLGDESTK